MATNHLAAVARESEVRAVYVLQYEIQKVDESRQDQQTKRQRAIAIATAQKVKNPGTMTTPDDPQASKSRLMHLQGVEIVHSASVAKSCKQLSENVAEELDACQKQQRAGMNSDASLAIHKARCAAIEYLNSTRDNARASEPDIAGLADMIGRQVLRPDGHVHLDEMRTILEDADGEAWSMTQVWQALRRCHGQKANLAREAEERNSTLEQLRASETDAQNRSEASSNELAGLRLEHEDRLRELKEKKDALQWANAQLRTTIPLSDHQRIVWEMEQESRREHRQDCAAHEKAYEMAFEGVKRDYSTKLEAAGARNKARIDGIKATHRDELGQVKKHLAEGEMAIKDLRQQLEAAQALAANGDAQKNARIQTLTDESSLQFKLCEELQTSRDEAKAQLTSATERVHELEQAQEESDDRAQQYQREAEQRIESLQDAVNEADNQKAEVENLLSVAKQLKEDAESRLAAKTEELQAMTGRRDETVVECNDFKRRLVQQESAVQLLNQSITVQNTTIEHLQVEKEINAEEMRKLRESEATVREALSQERQDTVTVLTDVLQELHIARDPEHSLLARVRQFAENSAKTTEDLHEVRSERDELVNALRTEKPRNLEHASRKTVRQLVGVRLQLEVEQSERLSDRLSLLTAFCSPELGKTQPERELKADSLTSRVRSLCKAWRENQRLVLPLPADALAWSVSVAHGNAIEDAAGACPSGPAQQLWLTAAFWSSATLTHRAVPLVEVILEKYCNPAAKTQPSDRDLAFIWSATILFAAHLEHFYLACRQALGTKGHKQIYVLLRCVEGAIRLQCPVNLREMQRIQQLLLRLIDHVHNAKTQRPLLWALCQWIVSALNHPAETPSFIDLLRRQIPQNMNNVDPADIEMWLIGGAKILAVDDDSKIVAEYEPTEVTCELMPAHVTFSFTQPRQMGGSTDKPFGSLQYDNSPAQNQWRQRYLPTSTAILPLDLL